MSAPRALEDVGGPVLAICAHPDDIEIHAGGLAARLVQSGESVEFVLVTSGDRGTADPTQTREQVAAIREVEQRRAADALGVDQITFLRFPDGDVQFEQRSLREQIVRLIREKRPRTIITHDPFGRGENGDPCSVYPDHRAVGAVVFEAAYVAAPAPLYYPEMLSASVRPHKPERLLCVMSDRPAFFIDIGATFDRKWEAVRQHRSQGRALAEMERLLPADRGRAGCPRRMRPRRRLLGALARVICHDRRILGDRSSPTPRCPAAEGCQLVTAASLILRIVVGTLADGRVGP